MHEANGALFVARDDMIVAWERETGGSFEPDTTPWIMERLDGGCFVDVGASTGWFAIPVAMTGCSVIAFEPHRPAFDRLMENAHMNGVEIEAHNAAVGDSNGRAQLHFNISLPLTSGASILRDQCLVPSGRTTVEVVRLDGAITSRPCVVKIDVEGGEMDVLKGAAEIVARWRPFLVLEANTDTHRRQLAGWLHGNGYRFQVADERNMLCEPQS